MHLSSPLLNAVLIRHIQAAPPVASPDTSSTPAPAVTPSEDAEAEKRKARAARFGIPVVEPKPAPAQKNGRSAANGKTVKAAVAEVRRIRITC